MVPTFFENETCEVMKDDLKLNGRYTEERRVLDEALSMVGQSAILLKNAMASGDVSSVLLHSSQLISELRTSALGFQNYSTLYTHVITELQHLYTFFCNTSHHKRSLPVLYVSVQQAGNVIPRLYLLTIVGVACVIKHEMQANVVLSYLVLLCKAVQHPLRGLFLRHFLLRMSKDILQSHMELNASPRPSKSILTNDYTSEHTHQQDATVDKEPEIVEPSVIEARFDFLCSNFIECLRLWRRLFILSPLLKTMKKETQVHLLDTFVMANIKVMTHIRCVDPFFFKSVGLPRLFKVVRSCRDISLQGHILHCLVEAFDEECHIEALHLFVTSVCDPFLYGHGPSVLRRLILKLKTYLEISFLSNDELCEKSESDESLTLRGCSQQPDAEEQENVEHEKRIQECDAQRNYCEGVKQTQSPTTEIHQEGMTVREGLLVPSRQSDECSGYIMESHMRQPTTSVDTWESIEASTQEVQPKNNHSPTCQEYHHTTTEQYESNTFMSSQITVQCKVKNESKQSTVCATTVKDDPCSEGSQDEAENKEEDPRRSSKNQRVFQVYSQLRSGIVDIIRITHAKEFDVHTVSDQITAERSTTKSDAGPTFKTLHILLLLEAFLDFVLSLLNDRLDLVDSVFELVRPVLLNCQESCKLTSGTPMCSASKEEQDVACQICALPFMYKNSISLFYMSMYSSLLTELNEVFMPYVFQAICNALIASHYTISTIASVEQIFRMGVAKDRKLSDIEQASDREAWINVQLCVAKLIYLISVDDKDMHFSMLTITWNYIVSSYPDSYQFTFPSFISNALALFFELHTYPCHKVTSTPPRTNQVYAPAKKTAETRDLPLLDTPIVDNSAVDESSERSHSNETPEQPTASSSPKPEISITPMQVLHLVYSACTTLMDHNSEMGYYVTLQAAEATSVANQHKPDVYVSILSEFLRQCLLLYEDHIVEKKFHVRALTSLVVLVSSQSSVLDLDTFNFMSETLTRHGAKLLKKSEQCLAILQCSHVFWNPDNRERCFVFRIRECLEKSLKTILSSLQYSLNDLPILIDVLDTYLYYFEQSSEIVPADTISKLISLCSEQLNYAMDPRREIKQCFEAIHNANIHLQNTLRFVAKRRADRSTVYADIDMGEGHY